MARKTQGCQWWGLLSVLWAPGAAAKDPVRPWSRTSAPCFDPETHRAVPCLVVRPELCTGSVELAAVLTVTQPPAALPSCLVTRWTPGIFPLKPQTRVPSLLFLRIVQSCSVNGDCSLLVQALKLNLDSSFPVSSLSISLLAATHFAPL